MKNFFLLLLLLVFSLTSCATMRNVGSNTTRAKIFSPPDWSDSDTRHLRVIIEYTYSGQGAESWSAASRPSVVYTVSEMKFLLNSDYYVKQFVITKEDKETGLVLKDEVLASKKKSGAEFWTWRTD